MRLKDWREVIFEDSSRIEVTEETVRNGVKMAQMGYRTDMRIATGRVYTDAQYESWRAKVLNTPLP
jgi:hypothetical protein